MASGTLPGWGDAPRKARVDQEAGRQARGQERVHPEKAAESERGMIHARYGPCGARTYAFSLYLAGPTPTLRACRGRIARRWAASPGPQLGWVVWVETVSRPEASAAAAAAAATAYLQTFRASDGGSWKVVGRPKVDTVVGLESADDGCALPWTVTETVVVAVAPSSSVTVRVNM